MYFHLGATHPLVLYELPTARHIADTLPVCLVLGIRFIGAVVL